MNSIKLLPFMNLWNLRNLRIDLFRFSRYCVIP